MQTETIEKTELIAYSLKGEFVEESIHADITKEMVQHLVENYPRNSFGMFFNDMFESENFIFVMNGKWYFFDAHTRNENQVVTPWDWTDSIVEFESFCTDEDEIEQFYNGWGYVSEGQFPENCLEFILKIDTPDSPMYQMELPTLNDDVSHIFFKKEIKDIIKNRDLSDDEKANEILSMMERFKGA